MSKFEVVVPGAARMTIAGMLTTISVVEHPSPRTQFLAVLQSFSEAEHLVQTTAHLRKRLAGLVVYAGRAERSAGLSDMCSGLVSRLGAGPSPLASRLDELAAMVKRIALAHQSEATERLIAFATVSPDGFLSVWSCEPRQYVVPHTEIPALASLTDKQLREFVVSDSGSRISWPAKDVDLTLDDVRYRCDEDFLRKKDRETRHSLKRYGRAIRALREEKGLRQSEIAGLTDRQIRRIEAGLVTPHAETMQKLAGAHGMNLPEYLNALAAASRG